MLKAKNIVKSLTLIASGSLLFGFVAQVALAQSKSRVEIHFWNAMAGSNKKALDKLIKDYNESQDKYRVISDYQGSYADTLSKYLSVAGSASSPDLVQGEVGIATQILRDSKLYKPVEDFVQREHYDKSQIEPRILQQYSQDNRLTAMPFNASTAVMYYNKELLESIGVNRAPETFEDISAIGQKLKAQKKDGVGVQAYGWIFEQMINNQAGLNLNEDNGQKGQPSRSLIDKEAGSNFVNWQKDLLKTAAGLNFGTDEATLVSSFASGKTAIIFQTSAYASPLLKNAKFKIGIAGLPRPEKAEKEGTALGGASLYIGKNRPSEKENGAWDFMKFLATPKEQASWAINTGYYPINPAAYKEPELIEHFKKYPELKNSVAQVERVKDSPSTRGLFSDVYLYARRQMEVAQSQVFNGKPSELALADAAQNISKELELSKQRKGD